MLAPHGTAARPSTAQPSPAQHAQHSTAQLHGAGRLAPHGTAAKPTQVQDASRDQGQNVRRCCVDWPSY